MTEWEKSNRAAQRFEIKTRELVLKRLSHPLALAQAAAEKKRSERLARLEALGEYKTFEEAHEAYGWGYISEEEFETIRNFLEHKEELKSERSAEEYAADILQEFVVGLRKEIASFKFELLPQKEQKRIQQQQAELLERHKKNVPGAW
jgi:hypothetical protein